MTPSASVAIKAHKPEKDCPARVITSHVGAPQDKLSTHLNSLLQPIIKKSKFICKNSTEFVEKMKGAKLDPGTKMFSYDAEALYPSVPINYCIAIIVEKL